jgi:hypothetical protein
MSIFDRDPRQLTTEELLKMPVAEFNKLDVNKLSMRQMMDMWAMFEAEETQADRYAPQKLWHDRESRAQWVTAGIEPPVQIQLTRTVAGVWYDQTGAYYTPEEVNDGETAANAVGRRRRSFREKLEHTDRLLNQLTIRVGDVLRNQSSNTIRQVEQICHQMQQEMKRLQLFVPTFEMTNHGAKGIHFAFSGPPDTPDYYALKYGTDVQPDPHHFPSFWLDEDAFKPKDKP